MYASLSCLIRPGERLPPKAPVFPMNERLPIAISRGGIQRDLGLNLSIKKPKYKSKRSQYVAEINATLPCFIPSIQAWFPASICLRAVDSIALLWARHAEDKINKNKSPTIDFPIPSPLIGLFSSHQNSNSRLNLAAARLTDHAHQHQSAL